MAHTQPELETLLDYLKQSRGFDFTGYKRASLERRILKRMQVVGISTFSDYLDYLEVRPDEFAGLFNTVLINVTGFFRDPATWEFIAGTIVPDLVARRIPGAAIRVWSAGCASGEEAYTLAMIFAEAVGVDAFKETVKIYATDIDDEALTKARQATYSEREVAGVPPELLARYFESIDDRYVFRKDLRRQVIFGRHDLIQDAPISHVDVLVCRNTLMYFNAETQARILSRFQFALNDGGVLFLGRAETMLTQDGGFAPIEIKHRISSKLPNRPTTIRDRLLMLAHDGNGPPHLPDRARLAEVALDGVPNAQLIVDTNRTLVFANERARTMFDLPQHDTSRPLQDLKISYRPVELRSTIDKVSLDRRPVLMSAVEWLVAPSETRWLDVCVAPLSDPQTGALLGTSISFTDVSAARRLRAELERANQELETAYEELQSTNEELETTNEELQSTIEELETTNEELQSTNEELETMNEELQSTNEELQTMNDEVRLRGDELNHANAFLESILGSLRSAVVVVDAGLTVLAWNRAAEDLWGLRDEEVRGKHILGLDVGLPTERLKQPIRTCLSGETEQAFLSVDAVNRRGRPIVCHITAAPLWSRPRTVIGVILVMEYETTTSDNLAPVAEKNGTKGITHGAKRVS